MASKNTTGSDGTKNKSPNRNRNVSKRPLTSPEDVSLSKKLDKSKTDDMSQDQISEKLKAIRVASSLENHSYIASASTQTNQGTRFRPASEHSFTGTWNKGTTDVINIEILSINGE